MPIILHLYMDYFFAQVEERLNPSLMNKPVVIGADPKEGHGRGVVSTCNYYARKFGIHSAMPISQAYKRCPNAVFLPVRYGLYAKVSGRIMEYLRSLSEKHEQVSVDEMFLDITDKVKGYEEARHFALEIKKHIWETEGLTCSIGVAPNKLVAKIGSDFKKPNGLTVVKPEEVEQFLAPQSVRRIWGIGPKTEAMLKKAGITKVGDLQKAEEKQLAAFVGSFAHEIRLMALGQYDSPVEESYEVKSINRHITFAEDTKDERLVKEVLEEMAGEIMETVRSYGFFCRTVTLMVRFEDFETHTASKTITTATSDEKAVLKIALDLLKPFMKDSRFIRLVGLKVSNFVEAKEQRRLV